LQFESRFEGGNLRKAFRCDLHEYNLLINSDTTTNKLQQRFYFRVRNMQKGVTYKFNINNMSN